MYNFILDIDSYKASHYKQYPPHTEQVSSYIESRGGKYSHTVFFGLQRFLKKYLAQPITREDIEIASEILAAHGVPFNREGWEYILETYNGFLPLKIEAVAEGALVPTRNVLVQITNTDPKCYWLTSYIETALLRAIWYPTTVATLSFKIKQNLIQALTQSTDYSHQEILEKVKYKLHDFGSRGASSVDTTGIGGLAHLVSFEGTDTVLAVLEGRKYYSCNMAGTSIPASEHSTITAWGKENEFEAYKNIIAQYLKPGKAVSLVCDSYNMDVALESMVGSPELKEKIVNSGGTLIIRPDSGNPVDIVCNTAQKLEKIFGVNFNKAGFKVLPEYIRIIQGDGINTNSITNICDNLIAHGYSVDNVAFGMGAELQQKVNRDTCRFAMKASAVKINGEWQDVFKAPVTDPSKTSKRGVLKLINDNGTYQTVRNDEEQYDCFTNELQTVYLNGQLLREYTLEEVRAQAESHLNTPVEYYFDK